MSVCLCMHVCIYIRVYRYVHGDLTTACGSQFSPPTLCVLGGQTQVITLVANAFTY